MIQHLITVAEALLAVGAAVVTDALLLRHVAIILPTALLVVLVVFDPAVGIAKVRQLPVGAPPVRVDGGAVMDAGLDEGPEHPLGPLVVGAGHLAGLPHHPLG